MNKSAEYTKTFEFYKKALSGKTCFKKDYSKNKR